MIPETSQERRVEHHWDEKCALYGHSLDEETGKCSRCGKRLVEEERLEEVQRQIEKKREEARRYEQRRMEGRRWSR